MEIFGKIEEDQRKIEADSVGEAVSNDVFEEIDMVIVDDGL